MMAATRQRRTSGNNALEELRKAIAEAMESGRCSAIEIAAAADISRMQVYRIRDGENVPSLDKAEKIAKRLGLTFRLEPSGSPVAAH